MEELDDELCCLGDLGDVTEFKEEDLTRRVSVEADISRGSEDVVPEDDLPRLNMSA